MAQENENTVVAETPAAVENAAEAAKPSFDRPALETKVSERLSALFSEAEPEDSDKTEEATDEVVASDDSNDDSVKGDDAGDEEHAEVDEEKEKKPEAAVKPPATGNAPTLPAAHRRSLHAYGWEDEEINANLKAIGASFLTTAAKLHSNRNAEVAGWAEAGRAARERAQAADKKQVTPEQAAAGQALKPLDMAALKEHFGEDKMLDALINPVNAAIERINQIMPQVQAAQTNSQQAELAALGKQIEDFFTSKELEPYSKLYGKQGTADFVQSHIDSRNKVLEMADALTFGAGQQGRKLAFKDAMQMAHDSVSTGYKVSAVRTEIVNKLKTRQAGISLKPSSKGSIAGSGPVKTKTDLEKRTAQRLRAVFGSN